MSSLRGAEFRSADLLTGDDIVLAGQSNDQRDLREGEVTRLVTPTSWRSDHGYVVEMSTSRTIRVASTVLAYSGGRRRH